jgi:hypothetical protein
LKILTIDEQIAEMAENWPDWQVHKIDDRRAIWAGSLTPNARTYRLHIYYKPPLLLEYRVLKAIQPLVVVDRPKLQRMSNNPEGPIPHVYWPDGDTDAPDPYLCLFDLDGREWSPTDSVAVTTVPWAGLWLNWYEGWLLTGKWLGSARHAAPEDADEPKQREREAFSGDAATTS